MCETIKGFDQTARIRTLVGAIIVRISIKPCGFACRDQYVIFYISGINFERLICSYVILLEYMCLLS